MNKRFFLGALLLNLCALTGWTAENKNMDSKYYEMRTYYAPEGKLDDLNARFRNHTLKIFAKHGIESIGYWMPIDNPERKLVYLLGYPSKEARDKSWKEFFADPEWQDVAKKTEANGKIVAKVESVFLKTTDYSPKINVKSSATPRVFELRTYTTPPGKLENLNARFRDHTLALFKKHGMENVAYWTKAEGQPGADTTLIYLLAHKSKETAGQSFDAFRKDPTWVDAKAASERDGPLTIKDGVKSEFLVPTDYSPLK